MKFQQSKQLLLPR